MEGPKPCKPKRTCMICGSELGDSAGCKNCGADSTNVETNGFNIHQPDPKGKQPNPYSNEGIFIRKNTPIARAANTKQAGTDDEEDKSKKKKKKKERLGDYKSDEFKMCKDEVMYSDGKNYDDKEVEKSCTDLAIDG